MADQTPLPQSIAADKAWGRLMHVVGHKVPRRLTNIDRSRRELRALTRRIH